MTQEAPRLRGRPDRIFVSVDESRSLSTLSFFPADAGEPIQYEDDKTGTRAMKDAQSISARYPGSTIHGPHFHTARPSRPVRSMRPRARKA